MPRQKVTVHAEASIIRMNNESGTTKRTPRVVIIKPLPWSVKTMLLKPNVPTLEFLDGNGQEKQQNYLIKPKFPTFEIPLKPSK